MSRKPLPTFDDQPAVYETPFPKPLNFQVVVKPRAPKTKVGSIIIAKRSQQADQATTSVGKILAIGSKAWSKGPQIDLSEDPQQPSVGDWVVYRQHAGQRLRVRKDFTTDELPAEELAGGLEEYVLVMVDTDILARFASEADAERFYAWV